MPTYEYRCPEGHESEDFVLKISDAKSEITCPACGAVAPRRMSAGSGFVFKGSGFYITDYGKDGKKDQRAAAQSGDGAASPPSTSGATAAANAAANAGASGGGSGNTGASAATPSSGAAASAPSSGPAPAPPSPKSPPKSSGPNT